MASDTPKWVAFAHGYASKGDGTTSISFGGVVCQLASNVMSTAAAPVPSRTGSLFSTTSLKARCGPLQWLVNRTRKTLGPPTFLRRSTSCNGPMAHRVNNGEQVWSASKHRCCFRGVPAKDYPLPLPTLCPVAHRTGARRQAYPRDSSGGGGTPRASRLAGLRYSGRVAPHLRHFLAAAPRICCETN